MRQSLRSSLDASARQRVFDRLERNASLAARIATVLAGPKASAKPPAESSVVPALASTYSVLCVGARALEGASARALEMLPDVALQRADAPVSAVVGESGAASWLRA